MRWRWLLRVASGCAVPALLATGCGGGNGGNGGEGTTSSTAAPAPVPAGVQHRFHPEFLEALRLFFDQLVPDRFTLEENSVRVADITLPDTEFKTNKDQGEFAREHGLLGFGGADFTASGGFEYWGIITWVFQAPDGARATFERFPDPERVTISDATKVDSAGEAYGGDRLGNLSVETYRSPDGVTTLFLRGSLVDGNALHYVSAVVDVPPGRSLDGLTEIRRVVHGLEGVYPEIFAEFLRLGGRDEPTTTTTRDPTFVPG